MSPHTTNSLTIKQCDQHFYRNAEREIGLDLSGRRYTPRPRGHETNFCRIVRFLCDSHNQLIPKTVSCILGATSLAIGIYRCDPLFIVQGTILITFPFAHYYCERRLQGSL